MMYNKIERDFSTTLNKDPHLCYRGYSPPAHQQLLPLLACSHFWVQICLDQPLMLHQFLVLKTHYQLNIQIFKTTVPDLI